jgi:hypothetical protein
VGCSMRGAHAILLAARHGHLARSESSDPTSPEDWIDRENYRSRRRFIDVKAARWLARWVNLAPMAEGSSLVLRSEYSCAATA